MNDRLLLDTHALLWWLADEQLDDATKARIATAEVVLASAASVWEVGIKAALGKLRVDLPFGPVLRRASIPVLAIDAGHADAAAALPSHHRDPFDRMLIAQARIEDLQVVTRDERFADYDVSILAC